MICDTVILLTIYTILNHKMIKIEQQYSSKSLSIILFDNGVSLVEARSSVLWSPFELGCSDFVCMGVNGL